MTRIYLNKFNHGIVSDPHDPSEGAALHLQQFDAFTYPHKLKPIRSSEGGASAPDTTRYVNFANIAGDLYALGVVSGGSLVQIDKKTDFTGTAWSSPTGGASASGARSEDTFVYYPKVDKLFGIRAARYVWSYSIAGTTFVESAADLTAVTNSAQGLVHSKDATLYLPYDNKIAKNFNDSWTVAALTLPDNFVITSLCEYGNYLAIGCRDKNGGHSRVFLWDRDSTVNTLAESIDWGEGSLYVLEVVNGVLMGISQSEASVFVARFVFRYYPGTGDAQKVREVISEASASANTLRIAKQVKDHRLYFMMSVTQDGTTREGVWSFSRKPDGTFGIALEYLPNNNTALTNGVLKNFFFVGDYCLISYVSNSAWGLSKTNDQATYTATSLFNTTINPNMPREDRPKRKQLFFVGAHYDSFPSGGSVVVRFRKDGASAWTDVFTETTTSAAYTLDKPFNSGEFRDGEFQIESTGGVEITGLTYEYKLLST